MKTYIGFGNVLVLENERGIITGVSLANRFMEKLHKLIPHSQPDSLYAIGIEPEDLAHFTETELINDSDFPLNTTCVQVKAVKESINQRITRQASYILNQPTIKNP